MEYIKLNNGVEIPLIGYGTLAVSDEETERCVLDAIEVGYRHIDTAQIYGNERGVGNAIKKCGLKREDLFITTKVWIANAGYEQAKESLKQSLENLQSEYIDLVLVHLPYNDYYGTWKALEEMYEAGKIKAIGISNFYKDRLYDLMCFSNIKPMINQLESHVFNQQQDMRAYQEKYNIKLAAWSPLAKGKNNIFNHEILAVIGKKYNKTASQIALKFLCQNNIVAIPKSSNKERMRENISIFDFKLDSEDIKAIKKLDEEKNLFVNVNNVEDVEKFFERFNLGV